MRSAPVETDPTMHRIESERDLQIIKARLEKADAIAELVNLHANRDGDGE